MGGLMMWIRNCPNINDPAYLLENRHENLPIQLFNKNCELNWYKG